MNSTLPSFLAAPPAPVSSPGAAPLNATALAGFLAGQNGASGESPPAPPSDFSTLMPAVPAAPVVSVQTTITPTAGVPPVITLAMPPHRFSGGPAKNQPAPGLTVPSAADRAVPSFSNWNHSDLAAVDVETTAGSPWLQESIVMDLRASGEVPPEIREQAVAFAASLVQSLLPEVKFQPQPAGDHAIGSSVTEGQLLGVTSNATAPIHTPVVPQSKTGTLPTNEQPAGFPSDRSVGGQLAGATSNGSLTIPVKSSPEARATSQLTSEQAATFPSDREVGGQLAGATNGAFPTNPSPAAPDARASSRPTDAAFVHSPLVVAEDGTLEFKLTLPPAAAAAKPDGFASPHEPVEFSAELHLPGQPVVRVESTGFSAKAAASELASTVPAGGPEKFAAKNRPAQNPLESLSGAGERKFEFTGDKELTLRSPETGITVAKTETIMPAAPIEETRAARNTPETMVLPARGDFQVAQVPAERITAAAPAPSGQNFAERAVDTVTNLIEAQFSASMQKSGSVQLRLQFGGEDLNVRVEIRDGIVHTDFRTDSAPLRHALEREWQAVAASSPEQMQRYVEPLFSAHSASSSSNPGQSDAQRQPNQQAQPDAQHRSPRESQTEHHAFSRRSLVGESFVPEPPVPRVAAFLPTSLRLSALA